MEVFTLMNLDFKPPCEPKVRAYLVGGAVRDFLLGKPILERDWVVLGESSDSMLKKGFLPVGKDFPVFLHPQTREEYALARTERKSAPGYRGFVFHASPDVTLEEDLGRRDLTINAMAMDSQGHIFDPYGGLEDIKKQSLKHVTAAFREDPVRVLRTARFAATLFPMGFTINPETNALMREMVNNGEVSALVPERVWAETLKSLKTQHPSTFFDALFRCHALGEIFPEIHPATDWGLKALDVAATQTEDLSVRFSTLVHDLENTDQLQAFLKRLRIPVSFQKLALKVMRLHPLFPDILKLDGNLIMKLLSELEAFRKSSDFEAYLSACAAIYSARGQDPLMVQNNASWLRQARDEANKFTAGPLLASGLTGEALGKALFRQRAVAVDSLKRS